MTVPIVVAIDGPAGAGKSTVARALARRLGIPYLDTGAMYRAAALYCARRRVDPSDDPALARTAAAMPIALELGESGTATVLLGGRPVGEEIRQPEVSALTSRIAVHPAVRRRLVELQRQFVGRHGGVMEGRDIGTVVVPETPFKFFLEAAPDVRAARRHAEHAARGEALSADDVARQIAERDARDAGRSQSPLAVAPDAMRLDSSLLSVEQVVEAMLAAIARRR